jgi:hypothetical protein
MATQRNNYGAEFKARVALEALKGHKTINELVSHFGVHPTQINKWKRVCFFRNDTANSSFPVLSNVLFGQPVFPPETSFKGARAEGFSANLAW